MFGVSFFGEYDGRTTSYTPEYMNNACLEGYSGEPSHFIVMENDRRMISAQENYINFGRKNFEKNKNLIERCIKTGIMLPPFEIQSKK